MEGNEKETSPLLKGRRSSKGPLPEDHFDTQDAVIEPSQLIASKRKEWIYKLLALICSCLLSVGSHYASHMLNALKGTLKEELGITNAQYGLLQSAVSLVNTVIPFFAGIFIDVFGTGPGSLVASTLIFFGDAMVAISTHLESFPMMILGRVIYGIGSGCIVTVQEAILAHWFKGKWLAITVGIQISISRLSSFLATGTVVPISEATEFYGNAFWVSTGICGFSWLINLVYVVILRKIGENTKINTLEEKISKKSHFKMGALLQLPSIFWVISLLSFTLGGCWGPFLHISPELVKFNFGSSDASAAWETSAGLAIPVIISPILGYVIDRYGKRSWIALISGSLLVFSFYLLGFVDSISPLLGLILFSFSYSLGPVSLISSIPLVLDISLVGSALGIFKCASNIGSTIVDPIIGMVQDLFDSYNQVMMILILFAILSICGAIIMLILDYSSLKRLLDLPGESRKVMLGAQIVEEIAPKPKAVLGFSYILISTFLLLFSWVVYIGLVIDSFLNEGE